MKISDLVDKVEAFKFEYDGIVLEGTWYKYRTTTPRYAKAALATIPDINGNGTDEEKAQALKRREDATAKMVYQIMADTILTWNVENDDGAQLPPSQELFEELPRAFTEKFLDFFNNSRENGANPTLPSSPIT